MASGYADLKNELVSAANGAGYAPADDPAAVLLSACRARS
jgi:hypothetical protein